MDLTKLEYGILEFLSMNPGQVFDRERIYEKVCGYDAEGGQPGGHRTDPKDTEEIPGVHENRIYRNCMGNGIPMDKIKNLSLKKTILLYLCVSLICSFLLSALVGGIASEIQQQIWWKYVDQDQYIQAEAGENSNYTVRIPRPSASRMSRRDHQVSELCDFLETYSVLLISLAGSGGAVFLFYRNKLKPPIEELGRASKMIGENNLDFQVDYTNKDEMGQLCQEFERMRRQLVLNNQKLWRTIEEEKALRSAVSHDLRSPPFGSERIPGNAGRISKSRDPGSGERRGNAGSQPKAGPAHGSVCGHDGKAEQPGTESVEARSGYRKGTGAGDPPGFYRSGRGINS